MKIKYLITLFFICMIIYLSPAVSMAAVRQGSIVFSDGKLSASLRQAPFNDIITLVSEKTGIQIYIFDDTDNKTLTLEFSDRSVESGLRSILRGVNYAVVYQSNLDKGNVEWVNNLEQRKKAAARESGTDRGRKALPGKKTPSGKRYAVNSRMGLENSHVTKNTTGSMALNNEEEPVESSASINNEDAYETDASNSNKESSGEVSDNSIQEETTELTESSNVEEDADGLSGSSVIEASKNEIENLSSAESDMGETGDSTYAETDSDEIGDSFGDEKSIEDLAENSDEQLDTAGSAYQPSWYYEGISEREAILRTRIDDLNKQIEGGYADMQYDLWVSIKGEKYVTHAKDLRDGYQKQLDDLLEQE